MKNLVTGATGFIGSHIAERLMEEGEDVVALVRRSSNTQFLESIMVRLSYGDINDFDSLKIAMKGVDRIYHCAAIAEEWISQKEAYRVNVEGTRNLLECARVEKVKRFIFISSLAVLGMKDHYGTPRDAPYHKSGDSYIDTKIDSEKLVLEYHRNFNLPVTVIRPGFVFGPRDKKFIPRILERLSKDKFIFVGNGKNKIDVVYIDNLLNAILLAGKNQGSVGQIYNVTNDSGMDLENFIFKIADVWRFKRPSRHMPKFIGYLVCRLLGTWAAITKSKKPPYITKTGIKFLSLNLDFDITRTREELGYEPLVDIEEGLMRTKRWMEEGSKNEFHNREYKIAA